MVPSRDFGWQEAVFAGLMIAMLSTSLSTPDSATEVVTKLPTSSAGQIGSLLSGVGMMIFLALLLLVFLRVVRGHDVAALFGLRHLGPGRALKTALVVVVPVYIVVSCSSIAINELLRTIWPEAAAPQETVEMFQKAAHPAIKVIMVLAAVVSAPLVEELIFRGFLYPLFKRYTDAWIAAPLNALLFALIHMHVGSFIPLCLFAIALIAAYEFTGSLLVPIFMHASFNALSTGLLLSGLDLPQ
jgi:membrane protease YdiL (CAAX protease family)